ncbi:DUF4760 domain-containing protein [Bacillus toyonensis]|uniref:DUF4760 domain-containing protein n=1 Tax=Bacillus toyonensis TaxID=155322 RepID=UPI001C0E2D41|nr:hypothetical protein [Bacillus toyonensis]MBU4642806.1 hypothetical protein [Bacillus toyonensis]
MWDFIKENYRSFLEALYFLSGIGMLGTVIIGLRQLSILKQDVDLKNKRAAVEKSIEYMNWFASDLLPQAKEYRQGWADLQPKVKKYKYNVRKDFSLTEEEMKDKQVHMHLSIDLKCGGQEIINQLEYVGAAFISGIADEELAFTSLASIYCETIEELYLLISFCRTNGSENLYSNTIKLYEMWKDRLKKSELENKIEKMNQEMSEIKEQKVKPMGYDIK